MTVEMTIPIEAVGKQRPKAARQGNNIKVYTPRKTESFEKQVRDYYLRNKGPHFGDKPLKVYITATFPIPKSFTKKKLRQIRLGENLYTKKPDVDNIAKSILDALNDDKRDKVKVAYQDDKQVIELHVQKKYAFMADPGCAEAIPVKPTIRLRIEEYEIEEVSS